MTNCRTLECEVFKNTTAYELTLKVLIFAYDNGGANFNGAVASENYVWDTEIEVKDKAKELNIFGVQETYPTACVGIKEMAYILDEEHWLIEMDGYVTPKHYDTGTGLLTSYINMKFTEWKSEMKLFSVSPFLSKFAKRKSGYALLNMNVLNIQFSNAKIIHGKLAFSSFWIGKNNDSSGEDAYNKVDITNKLKFNN